MFELCLQRFQMREGLRRTLGRKPEIAGCPNAEKARTESWKDRTRNRHDRLDQILHPGREMEAVLRTEGEVKQARHEEDKIADNEIVPRPGLQLFQRIARNAKCIGLEVRKVMVDEKRKPLQEEVMVVYNCNPSGGVSFSRAGRGR